MSTRKKGGRNKPSGLAAVAVGCTALGEKNKTHVGRTLATQEPDAISLTVIEDTSVGAIVAAVSGGAGMELDLIIGRLDSKVILLGTQTVGGCVGSVADGSEWAGQAPSLVVAGRGGEQGVRSNSGQFLTRVV